MTRQTPWLWASLALVLLYCAATTSAQDVTASHWDGPKSSCSSSAQCSTGSSCLCTCQSRHRSASAAAGSSDTVSAATHGGSWLAAGAACSLRRVPGQAWARCRPGTKCSCSCISSPPIGGNDTFTFADPEGPEGPGSVTVHVLDNDVDPDGTAVHITPGSMQSLTPGVTVTSVDEAEGTALITIPDATKNVQLSYSPVDATGQVGATVFMAGFGTPAASYPAGSCVAGSQCSTSGGTHRSPFQCGKKLKCAALSATCASKSFAKSVKGSSTYCMADFRNNCDSASNAGCNRCAIYQIMKTCAKATPSGGWPFPTQALAEACRYHSTTGKYVIVKSRMLDKSQTSSAQTNVETGTNICLMNKHYIVMPTAACTGVDDNKKECTGDDSKAYWDGAVRHGYNSGQGDLGFGNTDWAVMINAPEERGQHQMHIHVAPLATGTNILRTAKGAQIETVQTKDPTVITQSPRVVAAYYIQDSTIPPVVKNHDVYAIAASIHAKYTKNNGLAANDLSYGVALIPKKGGFIVAAAYGFADVDVLDTSFTNNPVAKWCQAQCTPFN